LMKVMERLGHPLCANSSVGRVAMAALAPSPARIARRDVLWVFSFKLSSQTLRIFPLG
jgi:hypothetical protein